MKCTKEELILMGCCLQRYCSPATSTYMRMRMYEDLLVNDDDLDLSEIIEKVNEIGKRFGWL